MRRSDGFFNVLLSKCRRPPIVTAALAAALFLPAAGSWANPPADPAVKLLFTIKIPPASTNATRGMYSYDISFVDQTTQTFYLSDRSNQAVDVVDAKTGTFVERITATPAFAGASPSGPELSGPNGVLTTPSGCIIASDAGARVVSFTAGGTQVSDLHLNTDVGRLDEMAFDPVDNLVLVNNPFPNGVTNVPRPNGYLVKVGSGCSLTKVARIPYTFGTNGAEQPVWDPGTKLFYSSIPQIGNASNSGGGLHGLVIGIDPKTATIVKMFHVLSCQPAGLALNPNTGELLIGCSVVFDSVGDVWDGIDMHTAQPRQVVIDASSGLTHAVEGVGASDEVTYNSFDDHWYTGSSGSPYAPRNSFGSSNTSQGANILGVINGTTLDLDQLVPTFSVPKTATHPAGSGHSVAANDTNGWVLVPSPANHAIKGCGFGCIQVFGR
jgi:hypothetical protein